MFSTILFIIGVICLIAGFDLFTWQRDGIDSTITRVVRSWGNAYPFFTYVVAFALGALFGHLFL